MCPHTLMNIIERCITGTIGVYQRVLSPMLGTHCRFYPSCSQYTIDAVRTRGAMVGLALGALRVARCNPLFPGGFDPIQEDVEARNRPADVRR